MSTTFLRWYREWNVVRPDMIIVMAVGLFTGHSIFCLSGGLHNVIEFIFIFRLICTRRPGSI